MDYIWNLNRVDCIIMMILSVFSVLSQLKPRNWTNLNFTDHEKVCVAEVYFLYCLLAIFPVREGEISHCKVKQMRLNAKL